MSENQRTIKNPVTVKGIGLHSGSTVEACFRYAPSDTGIVFRRVDLEPVVELKLDVNHIKQTPLCTVLAYDDVTLSTIEHALSAVAGLMIDNLYIDINGPEMPIVDGSAEPFVFALESAGIIALDAVRRFLRIREKITVVDNDSMVSIEPYTGGLRVEMSIDFKHPVIRGSNQSLALDISPSIYSKQIARARTFGAAKDLDKLQAQNLALGANLDNAIGLGDKEVLNPEGLRFSDEFVRHKMLDAIGDLYVTGHQIKGLVKAHKPSHALNNQLMRELMSCAHAWEWTS